MNKAMGIQMIATAALAVSALAVWAGESGVPYPEGYRHWTFLHSSMVPPTFGQFQKEPCQKPCTAGLFHFYANEKAMEGLRTGSYPDGAIIAEEMLEFLGNENGGGKEGKRRMVGVMVKDSQRYGAAGGWGFGSFEGESKADRLDYKERTTCFQMPRSAEGSRVRLHGVSRAIACLLRPGHRRPTPWLPEACRIISTAVSNS